MMALPIAASDFDVIIGIIAFVGWILAQVLSRKQKGKPETPPPLSTPEGTGSPASPQDEMRKFFDEMEKALNPRPAAPPLPEPDLPRRPRQVQPPPSPAPVPVPKARPIVTYAAKPVTQISLAPAPEPGAATPPPRTHPMEEETASRRMTRGEIGVQNIRREFENPAALRKMIVASEILGKPVSLRAPA
jgi:hypothetical protein